MKNDYLNEKIWNIRYIIALKEDFTVNDIKVIRDTSSTNAVKIRRDAIELLLKKNPKYLPPKTKVPAEAVFEVTGHDLKYYHDKMVAERKAFA